MKMTCVLHCATSRERGMSRRGENWTELLAKLASAPVEFIVVDGVATILNDVVYRTDDIDVVHRRSPENIEWLMAVLNGLDAYFPTSCTASCVRARCGPLRTGSQAVLTLSGYRPSSSQWIEKHLGEPKHAAAQ